MDSDCVIAHTHGERSERVSSNDVCGVDVICFLSKWLPLMLIDVTNTDIKKE